MGRGAGGAAIPPQALAELRARDPDAAARVDAANPRRVARALEIASDRRRRGRDGAGLWTGDACAARRSSSA